MNWPYIDEYFSPIGKIIIEADDKYIRRVYFDTIQQPSIYTSPSSLTALAVKQLHEYFKGTLKQFELPLLPEGSTFQQLVWLEVQRVHFGKTQAYNDIAKKIADPDSSRAVGSANGKNPILIMIPCHRILGQGGGLTGYAAGVSRKQWLLAHEQKLSSGVQTLF